MTPHTFLNIKYDCHKFDEVDKEKVLFDENEKDEVSKGDLFSAMVLCSLLKIVQMVYDVIDACVLDG